MENFHPNFKSYIAIFVCLLFSFHSNDAFSQSVIDCSKASTQAEINTCSQSKLIKVDKELNNLYKAILVKLDPQQKLTLIESQRKWISFRDEYSKLYKLIYSGGSLSTSAVLDCKTNQTKTRIIELKHLYEQIDR